MGWPIASSLGLHALLLGFWSGVLPLEGSGVAPTEPLQASLRAQPEAVARVAVAAVPMPSRMQLPPREPNPVFAAPDAVPPAPTFHEEARQEQAELTVPASSASLGGVPAAPVETKAVTVALANLQEIRGPDAAGLRQYRLALAGEARRYRSYPEAARREGVHGTAEVRISVGLGAQRLTELARSSGHALLDTAALEMLRSAAARTTLPESLRGQEFAVLLPVVFEVEE